MQKFAEDLASALLEIEGGELVVVTGAGISRASGIPTFRGTESGAIWRTSDVTLATREFFQRDPVGQWLWYMKRFQALREARPNPAHYALAELESIIENRAGTFRLVTQNIDTLHEEAGTRNLIKVHGTSDRVRCSRSSCRLGAPSGSLPIPHLEFENFFSEPRQETLPGCPECGSLLRAHVLFFDEYYLEHEDYRFAEAENLASSSDLMLFIGTSFSVGVTDMFLWAGKKRGIQMWSIDPAGGDPPMADLRALPMPAEEFLPEVCALLAARSASRDSTQA